MSNEKEHLDGQMEPITISVSEAARLLGLSRPKVYQIMKESGFPAFKVGTRTLVPVSGLREWVAQQAESGGV